MYILNRYMFLFFRYLSKMTLNFTLIKLVVNNRCEESFIGNSLRFWLLLMVILGLRRMLPTAPDHHCHTLSHLRTYFLTFFLCAPNYNVKLQFEEGGHKFLGGYLSISKQYTILIRSASQYSIAHRYIGPSKRGR